MNRRRFLSGLGIAGAATAAGCGDDGPSLSEPTSLGTVESIDAAIADGGGSFYVADAKAYIVAVEPDDRDELTASIGGGDEVAAIGAGYLALSEKCPHQNCRVPFCDSAVTFECRCHGSRYTRYGELTRGPADRGLDVYGLTIVEGAVTIDTNVRIRRDGEVTVPIEPEGPHCV